ncbi:MAG: hypothetical protein K9I94_11385 [Bacteroidales bacterium]|nr:hypothetical protein [Bacteroidales bacterium]
MKKIMIMMFTLLLTLPLLGQETTVSIENKTEAVPGPGFLVAVNADFSQVSGGVGAITLYIDYDTQVMDFNGLANQALTGMQANATNGTIAILWNNYQSPSILQGKLVDLEFDYHGGDTPLTFGDGSELSDSQANVINATFNDGSVTQVEAQPELNLTDMSATGGQTVEFPVCGTELYNIAGFDMKIAFADPNVVDGSVSITNQQTELTGMISNYDNGVMFISWSKDLSGNNLSYSANTKLFDLSFTFAGGSSDVGFNTGTAVYENVPGYPAFDPITLSGGSLYETFSVSLSANPPGIGVKLTGAGDYAVDETVNIGASVPSGYAFVEWTGTPEDVALLDDATSNSTSFTMPDRNVSYTATFEQVTFNVSLGTSPAGIGATLEGAGDYNIGTSVDISTTTPQDYVFVEWGGSAEDVALLDDPNASSTSFIMPDRNVSYTAVFEEVYSVSGQLLYGDEEGPAIPNSTVYLKTADGSTILQETTTDASGNYEFAGVTAGDYMLEVFSTESSWGGINAFDFIYLINHLNGNSPLEGLFLEAADINGSGNVNAFDGIYLKNRINHGNTNGWREESWLFNVETISIDGQDLTNTMLLGICTGDLNASNDF